ncbi:unnamed protein product [Rotaria sp. Silwood1]|nr:unnamed protein product [Rotaria sp. Silwood1]CAF1311011.1 unnamed protein product [Rotaria sp. Silwood1]CAF3497523.1 unnamed protein product [Rotaria sp. Silwood1]CAF3519478.1 unnamed protein product [Rotaria sp. Silwood1]CAF3549939.1 unnamed protein product [Rotaria sp. Silwood1]
MTSSEPEYDSISAQYSAVKKTQVGNIIEYYTVYKCILPSLLDDSGLLTGKRVLDLGCGEGRHTRQLKALGCDYILGVDQSSKMIDLAREAECLDPKGIEYLVGDAKQLPPPEKPFDLVTAFCLFLHAQTRTELLDMARTVYSQLGENKQLIGVTADFKLDPPEFNLRKYGLMKSIKASVDKGLIPDGTEVIITFYNEQDEPMCQITDYHYSLKTYEEVFTEAGFKSLQWVPYQCDPQMPNKAFFDDYIKNSNAIAMIATK